MDIGKAFSFVFEDEQWVASILIGGLILLIPIIGLIVLLGYTLETARNVAQGNPRPLPKWNTFGEKLGLGFAYFVIGLVYSLPLIVLIMLIVCVPLFAAGAGSDEGAAAALASFSCFLPLLIIVSLLLQPVILAAVARYLQMGSIGAALQVGEVITMVRADPGAWVVLWLILLLCGIIANLGAIIIIGFIFTVPYSQAVFGHAMGQTLQRFSPAAATTYMPPPPMV
ncbi:MAG: DUF4013 domain-containing protein [Oscillochloridaceae bacterium]|nr:DUF4013 domain-containing protein [Chloroflexaceae bacterium]MDW8391220.1 DUF4013 domain-containing protein [Oscillochloridaceae bacterium]